MAATVGAVALALLVLLVVMFAVGRVLGLLMEYVRLPRIIGEIVAGIILGPSVLTLVNPANPDYGFALEAIASLGIIILLFCIGLETRLGELRTVGRVATATATAGVITPLAGGTALLLALSFDWRAALFVGAAMVATSVGITARVLTDLHVEHSVPSRIILGAAVIDDVLGMVVLAIVAAVAAGQGASILGIASVVVAAVAFVLGVLFLGPKVVNAIADSPRASLRAGERPSFFVMAIAIAVCMALAAAAAAVGLAAIIGAFLAGVAFADVQGRYRIRVRMEPLSKGLAPFFFTLMGAKVTLGTVVSSPALLGLALALTAVAVLTKYVPCRIAARGQGQAAARVVGAGMIPRGEVGFIVAASALSAGIVGPPLFSVVVFMAVGTSLLGPPLLRAALRPSGLHGALQDLKVARALDAGVVEPSRGTGKPPPGETTKPVPHRVAAFAGRR